MSDIHNKLKELHACSEAIQWAENKTWEEIYNTCHRGDWLLWLFKRTNQDDLQLLTLAKGHCANTVRHLMKNERSIKAIDTAIAFGEGKATIKELNAAVAAADAAYAAVAANAAVADAAYAAAAAAVAAADAAYAAAAAAVAAADAAYAAVAANAAVADAAYAAADAAYAAAKKENRQLTANIVRKFIPIEKFKI